MLMEQRVFEILQKQNPPKEDWKTVIDAEKICWMALASTRRSKTFENWRWGWFEGLRRAACLKAAGMKANSQGGNKMGRRCTSSLGEGR